MEVLLQVDAGPDADDVETAELALQLRGELVEHDLDPIAPESASPSGAKGVGYGEIGSLLVALAASGGVLTTLLGVLQGWLLRHKDSRIVVEVEGDRIELTGVTDEERQRALDFWLARQEARAAAERSGGPSGAG